MVRSETNKSRMNTICMVWKISQNGNNGKGENSESLKLQQYKVTYRQL